MSLFDWLFQVHLPNQLLALNAGLSSAWREAQRTPRLPWALMKASCLKSPGFAPILWLKAECSLSIEGEAAPSERQAGASSLTDPLTTPRGAQSYLGVGEQTTPAGRQDTPPLAGPVVGFPLPGPVGRSGPDVGSGSRHSIQNLSSPQEDESFLPPRQERTYQMPPNH